MALEVFLIKQPHLVSFTGNPIPFGFIVAPYGNNERSQTISITIKLLVENLFGSNVFQEVKFESFYPDNQGRIEFDIKTILDPFVSFFTAPNNVSKPIIAKNQTIRYKLAYQLQQNNQVLTSVLQTSIFTAVKGGLNYQNWHPSEYFTNVAAVQKKPLNFIVAKQKAMPSDVLFLYWLYASNESYSLSVRLRVTDDAGNFYYQVLPNTLAPAPWQVCCVAYGFQLNNLAALLPPGSMAVSFAIQVFSGSDVYVNYVEWQLDYRQFYYAEQLVYRTSTGALDTVTLKGDIEFEADYERKSIVQISPPAYFQDALLMAQTLQYQNEETEKFIGNTGFISKEALLKLRDLLLSKQVYIIKNGSLLPININNRNTKFFSNKSSLFGLQVEYQMAYVNRFFTPENLLPTTRSCPAVEKLEAKQVNKNTIRIMYSVPFPYDGIEIEITIGSTIQTIVYNGNSGVFNQAINNPATTVPVLVTIKGRVICNQHTNDKGPQTTKEIYINGNSAPVANNSRFFLPAGYNTAVRLPGSVLDNDYDPDGDPIQVVASFGATSGGGTYSINAAGIVTYTPPSPVYVGIDFFTYTIQEVGGAGLTATATVFLTVGQNTVPVFAKLIYRNESNEGESGNTISRADVFIEFFSNAQGTTLLDVTQYNLTVNWRRTEQPGNNPPVLTDYNFTAVGSSVFLGNFVTYQQVTGGAPEDDLLYSASFNLLPGSGYSII